MSSWVRDEGSDFVVNTIFVTNVIGIRAKNHWSLHQVIDILDRTCDQVFFYNLIEPFVYYGHGSSADEKTAEEKFS